MQIEQRWERLDKMIYVAGIDIGSTTSKAVIMNEEEKILAQVIQKSGYDPEAAAEAVFDAACKEAGITRTDIVYCVSTGYGREMVKFANSQVTEITCHAKGAHTIFPDARGVIDIGGQDSKAIVLDQNGAVSEFAMNDKCAAGTGRFLDVMAGIMGISAEEMGHKSLLSKEELPISSICTVFAESEVISLISKKKNPYDIMAGVHASVARRVCTLVDRVKMPRPIMMSGGVGKNVGVIAAFEKILNTKLLVPDDPQIIGAVGAAAIALNKYKKLGR